MIQKSTQPWTEQLNQALDDSGYKLDQSESRHMLAFRLDGMGTLQATKMVSMRTKSIVLSNQFMINFIKIFPTTTTTTTTTTAPDTDIAIENAENMTTIDYEEIDATDSVSQSELCSVTSLETDSTTFNVAMVRHSQPIYLPLLILLQYVSTAWISEVIMTNFESPTIHHSCVRI